MRKHVALATLVLSVGLVSPASAATVDSHASCSAKLSSNVAGQPGARAAISHGAKAEANSIGLTLGDFQSEVARAHPALEFC